VEGREKGEGEEMFASCMQTFFVDDLKAFGSVVYV